MTDALDLVAAQHCVLEQAPPLGSETVELSRALGRVLAKDVYSNRNHPPHDVSAMDGYAVRAEDIAVLPAQLNIVADIKAGELPQIALACGQCARIMTGAKIPEGANAVVRVEDTQELAPGAVQINVAVPAGKDIRLCGEHLRVGQRILAAGDEITPGVLGMLAMAKCAEVEVELRPRVCILSCGDELEGLDEPFDADKIPDANSYALMGQVQALGIEPALLGIARDEPAHLREKLQEGLQCDVLLVSGGTSVGVHDLVRPTLEALGVRMHFWRVRMRPGHPAAFGTTPTCKIFCLPGNPVASMVSFEQLVLPALRRMMGLTRIFRRTVSARLAQPLKHRAGDLEFVRVTLSRDADGYLATPTGLQSSGMLMSMAQADGLLVVPADSAGLAAGEEAEVQLLEGARFQESSKWKGAE